MASEPGLRVDVICTSRTQRVVGDNSHMLTSMSYFDSEVLLDETAQTTLHVCLRETGSTDMLCT